MESSKSPKSSELENVNSGKSSSSSSGSDISKVCEGVVKKKRRGRPPGSKNREGSKKPGPKVGSKRSKKQVS